MIRRLALVGLLVAGSAAVATPAHADLPVTWSVTADPKSGHVRAQVYLYDEPLAGAGAGIYSGTACVTITNSTGPCIKTIDPGD